MKNKILHILLLILAVVFIFAGCVSIDMQDMDLEPISQEQEAENKDEPEAVRENSRCTSMEEVALYLHLYNKLPSNYITKKKAMELGWKNEEGNLWEVTEQMSIGGDVFGNREGKLPKKDGRKWYECDINYEGGYRGAERIVYSNDGLIYYTNDHYETFTQIY